MSSVRQLCRKKVHFGGAMHHDEDFSCYFDSYSGLVLVSYGVIAQNHIIVHGFSQLEGSSPTKLVAYQAV